MKIYSVITTSATGGAPDLGSIYFTNFEEAHEEFQRSVLRVGDDPVTIVIDEFDTMTETATTLEFFSGNEEDLAGMPAA